MDDARWGMCRWGFFRWGIIDTNPKDKSVVGVARINHFRLGVSHTDFQQTLEKFESIPSPKRVIVGESPACIVGSDPPHRIDVYTDHWDLVKKRFETYTS